MLKVYIKILSSVSVIRIRYNDVKKICSKLNSTNLRRNAETLGV